MSTNEIIQVVGVFYFLFGLSYLSNRKYYKGIFKDIFKSKILLLAGGVVSLIIGIIIIINFNTWTFSKDGLVTFIGWIAFLKGGFLLLFPQFMKNLSNSFINTRFLDLILMGVSVSGLILMYLGFVF